MLLNLQKPLILKKICYNLVLISCKLKIIFMQTKFIGNLKFSLCKILSCRKNLAMFEIFEQKNFEFLAPPFPLPKKNKPTQAYWL